MGLLRRCFGDPFVGMLALCALAVIGGILLSALRQVTRERAYRRYVKNKQRRPAE